MPKTIPELKLFILNKIFKSLLCGVTCIKALMCDRLKEIITSENRHNIEISFNRLFNPQIGAEISRTGSPLDLKRGKKSHSPSIEFSHFSNQKYHFTEREYSYVPKSHSCNYPMSRWMGKSHLYEIKTHRSVSI